MLFLGGPDVGNRGDHQFLARCVKLDGFPTPIVNVLHCYAQVSNEAILPTWQGTLY